ncbi:sialoadhesin-like isoform X1 [Anoplopoma fimbria]|uniref:sialoadhesin-like isoform X1 n=1 Tax=Anoplopoma fimbria TaxID=229290 RepID=UPI0023EADEE2|nr:sialoadhesin-like isoform X1 [Anoplopoma fimbria]
MLQPADTMKATLLFLLLLSVCQTSVHSRASVTVTPNKSQFVDYDKVSVSCEQMSSGEWTTWRCTTKSKTVTQCGVGWGKQNSSTCVINSVKQTDSGVYWCQSKQGESSNTVNITVIGGPVILRSPVLPVMEGHDVTLSCRTTTSSNLPAGFYKDGSFIRTEPEGHMTIQHVTKSDEGLYRCNMTGGESPPSWLLMKDDSDPVSLSVSPDSSQLLEYENLYLSCGDNSGSHGWRVNKFNATTIMSSCKDEWRNQTTVGCFIQMVKHSATYWCESPAKQRSNSVKISVTGGPVILRSPVLPVMEGHDVTLSCRTTTSSNLPAGFYKDGSFIRTEPEGHMTIQHVTKSDEGLYRCKMTGGESPPSWLSVTGQPTSTAPPPASTLTPPSTSEPPPSSAPSHLVFRLVCHLVVFCPYCISTFIVGSLY